MVLVSFVAFCAILLLLTQVSCMLVINQLYFIKFKYNYKVFLSYIILYILINYNLIM